MTTKPSPSLQVIKKEEKEAKLRSFLQRRIASLTITGAGSGVACLKLIARSFDSPAVKALAAEAAGHGVLVEAIVVKYAETDRESAQALATALAGKLRCRVVDDTRLLDAHEQIIVDDASVWIGDCMRRDPEKRDAFERYAENAHEMAAWARICFDRLWRNSAALAITPAASPAPTECEPMTADAMPAGSEITLDSEIEVLTRH